MSIQKKTLAVLVAASLGMSFGASANGFGNGGWFPGHGGGQVEDPECCTGGTNTNDDGNQAGGNINDNDKYIDITKVTQHVNKDFLNNWDNSVRIKLDTKLNFQSNVTKQGGKTGDTVSASMAKSGSASGAGNAAHQDQDSTNAALGLGLGAGLGVGLGAGQGSGGDGGSVVDFGLTLLGFDKGDYNHAGDGGNGPGYGAGLGAGAGVGAGSALAMLKPDQDLDQNAASVSQSSAFSVSMIKSGNNTIGNSGAMHGINVQQGISGHSSMGNQSVNVNASVQF